MMNYRKKSVADIDVKGKKVLLRCEFNVPLDKDCNITDDKRIVTTMPTIKYLLDNGASVILCSHIGRPKGKVVPELSMAPVAKRISEYLGFEVIETHDVAGEKSAEICASLQPGQVAVLENLRFDEGEEKNDPEFSKKLASLADIFVNDAFGAVHRAHASNCGVTKHLPAVCGLLIEHELDIMGTALENPDRPYIAIVGGKKITDKLELINRLLDVCDRVLVLGGMSFTFFKARGGSVGESIVDESKFDLVRSLMARSKELGGKLLLPFDNVAINETTGEKATFPAGSIPEGFNGMDIGEKTIAEFSEIIKQAKTVIWNGPAGVFEMEEFENGTKKIAQAIIDSGAFSIIGGGDSAAAVHKFGMQDGFTHVSTGGGASLEFIEGKVLPGIESLMDKT